MEVVKLAPTILFFHLFLNKNQMGYDSYNFLEFRLKSNHNDQMFIFVLKKSEIGLKSTIITFSLLK